MALIVVLARPGAVAGHAQLESSSPPADALIAVPPGGIVLRFTEPVDPSGVTVRLVGEDGADVAVSGVAVDASDHRTVRAVATGIGFGITTVSWTNRSTTDGHTLSGSFAFRVGGSSRAPAAATVEGDQPAPWNVATRWLSFLGLALLAGSAMVVPSPRGRRLLAAAAAGALLATLAEPLLLWAAPPAGWEAPSLGSAVGAQPGAWWLRPAAALLALALLTTGETGSLLGARARARRRPDGTGMGAGERRRRPPRILTSLRGSDMDGAAADAWVGRLVGRYAVAAAGLVGLLGLGLTAHAAGRESYRLPALLSVILHEWSVALWVGGLLLVVARRTTDWTADLRGFSRRVLPVALLAVATGLINAGFLFPSVDRLRAIRESDYGWVLLAKVAVVGVVLAFAGLHRLSLRGDGAAPRAFRVSLPAEAVAVVAVLVAAATLAMLAPPGEAREAGSTRVELALPASPTVDTGQMFVDLAIEPGAHQRRRLTVSATQGIPERTVASPDGGYAVVRAPLVPDLQLARVTLTSLGGAVAPTTLDLTASGDGTFARDGFVFAVDGWWQADVTVRRQGVQDTTVSFYLLEPDPNVVGFDRVPAPASDPAAAAIQVSARAKFDARTSYAYLQEINAGQGGVEVIETDYSDNAGAPGGAGVAIRSSELEMVRLDGRRYVKQGDGDWLETDDSPVLSAAEVAADYDGAEQIRSAGQEEIDGELCDRVTFHVPATGVAAAWYIWWVSVATGEVRREAMVSRAHYMVKRYDAVNAPSVIAAPV